MLRSIIVAVTLLVCLSAAAEEPTTIALVSAAGSDAHLALDQLRLKLELTKAFVVLGGSDHRGLSDTDNRKVAFCRDLKCVAAFWGGHGAVLTGEASLAGAPHERILRLTVLNGRGEVVYEGRESATGKDGLTAAAETLSWGLVDALQSRTTPTLAAATTAPERPPPSSRSADPAPDEDWTRSEHKEISQPSGSRHFGIVGGLELGLGPWFADPKKIRGGVQDSFNFTDYGPAFTASIDGRIQPALNLHGGWNFLDLFAFEAAFQSSFWNPGNTASGGALLVGVRGVATPLHQLLLSTGFDVSLELGGGYAFVGASGYDMDGGYFTAGLGGEYRLTPLLGVGVFYRLFTPFLSKFYVDYQKGVTEPVHDFTAVWHTFGVSAVVHIPIRL